MSANYFYTNGAASLDEFEGELAAFNREGVVVDLSRAAWERSAPTVAPLERPGMKRLLQRIRTGDTIVVFALTTLGRNIREVLETLSRLAALGVSIRCVQLGEGNLTDPDSPALRTLIAVSDLEHRTRSARMKQSAAASTERGNRLGRKPAVSSAMHDNIRAALGHGTTVSELAREFHVSRQTIMRIRDRNAT